jgi:FixJ family two-component response regulator
MARPDATTLAVVDDDDDVRTALDRLLRAMGYQVVGFASAEAFEARSVDVDCAIVDMRLPGMSGLELCERLRRSPSPLPTVLVTGDAHQLAADLPAASDSPFLNKPFDDVALSRAIASAMAGPGTSRVD